MFKRDALNWLNEWKDRENRKPLVIRGARQVGKTSLVKEFGKQFDTFLSFNLEMTEDLALFQKEIPVRELYDTLLIVRHRTKRTGTTLLFIDEIQNSLTAIKMLRYFYEEFPEVHVSAAGSLLETMLNRQVSFPVGRVEYMALRPCTFDEFLGAMGETALQEMVRNLAVPEILHSKVLSLFNKYVLVGGMPQAVADYARHQDLVALDAIYQSLLAGYIDDVEKYQSSEAGRNVLRFLITNGWGYAAERVTFERFGNSNYRSREIGEAFRTLQKTMLLELAYPTTDVKLPLRADLRKRPKLLWLDTGLVNYAAGVQSEVLGKEDINDAWRGKIAEHVIGQELIGQSYVFLEKRYFWVKEAKNSQAEVDFLYKHRQLGLVPIEVKSGTNAHLKSLQAFMQAAACPIALRFWSKSRTVDTISLEGGRTYQLHSLPYYYAGQVERYLSRLENVN